MSITIIIVLLIISLIVLIVGLVYISEASTSIKSFSYQSDADLVSAETKILWGTVIGWIAVIGIVIGTIALFTAGEELFLVGFGADILAFSLFISIFLIILVGSLAATAASEIANSSTYKADQVSGGTGAVTKAYDDAVISAAASLGSFFFVLICAGGYYLSERNPTTYTTSTTEYTKPYIDKAKQYSNTIDQKYGQPPVYRQQVKQYVQQQYNQYRQPPVYKQPIQQPIQKQYIQPPIQQRSQIYRYPAGSRVVNNIENTAMSTESVMV